MHFLNEASGKRMCDIQRDFIITWSVKTGSLFLVENYKHNLSCQVLSIVHSWQEFSVRPSKNNPVAGKYLNMNFKLV